MSAQPEVTESRCWLFRERDCRLQRSEPQQLDTHGDTEREREIDTGKRDWERERVQHTLCQPTPLPDCWYANCTVGHSLCRLLKCVLIEMLKSIRTYIPQLHKVPHTSSSLSLITLSQHSTAQQLSRADKPASRSC